MGQGTKKDLPKPLPNSLKIPVQQLNGRRAGWLLAFSRGKRSKAGALDLFRGNYCMFSGTDDLEMRNWVQTGALYEAEFTVAYDAAQARASFEATNPEFCNAAREAAAWAANN